MTTAPSDGRPGSVSTPFHTTPEYDAFGPWVLQVTTPDEVPPLFRAARVDPAAARLVLKVPRPVARRDATPTMDLYDHLVAVHDDGLTVLTREDGGFRTRAVPASGVLGLQDTVDLLDGRFTVFTDGPQGPLTVPYNGSSTDLVGRLADALRGLYRDALPSVAAPPAAPEADLAALGDDLALVGRFREIRHDEPALRLLAAHPRRTVEPSRPGSLGTVDRLWHQVWPMVLHAAVVGGDGRELQLLHRRRWLVRGSAPVHSVGRTVLPLARAGDVVVRDHERYARVRVVSVRLGVTRLDLPVPAGSDAEHVLLEALRH